MKESPRPPRTFLEFIIDGATARARFRKTANTPRPPCRRGQAPHRSTCLAGTVSAASGLMQGRRGRSPRRNKLWGSPFPGGEGGWGDGGKKETEGRDSRRQRRQAPPCAPPTPPAPAPPGTSPRWARGLLPCSDAPSGSAPEDARGEDPCMK